MQVCAKPLPPSAQRVQAALDAAGVAARVIEPAVAARTSHCVFAITPAELVRAGGATEIEID